MYLNLKCRWYRLGGGESVSQYRQMEKTIRLNTAETALVLVDTWEVRNMERYPFLPGLPRRFVNEIMEPIVRRRIKPTLEAARRLGLPVVHLPSYYVAEKYPAFRGGVPRCNVAYPESRVVKGKPPAKSGAAWPPPAYVTRRLREWQHDRYGVSTGRIDDMRRQNTYIHSALTPIPGEYVLSNKDELHWLLQRRKITNLLYAGFMLNACLLFKSGGLHDMALGCGKNYFCILLRDCTVAAENNHTLKDMTMTRCFTEWFEMGMGYTTARLFRANA